MKKYVPLLYIYLILGLITIYTRLTDNQSLEYVVKPALMLVLGIFFVLASEKKNVFYYSILGALFFSWLGDIFLMFPDLHERYFIFGLLAFLIGHIAYIRAFYQDSSRGGEKGLIRRKPWLVLPFLLYGTLLMYVLAPTLDEMLLPVMVYAAVILIMCIMALNRYGQAAKPSVYLVVTGAIIFVFSDSMIAINRFYAPFAFAGAFIMFTYVLAQYLIVLGSLYHLNNEESG